MEEINVQEGLDFCGDCCSASCSECERTRYFVGDIEWCQALDSYTCGNCYRSDEDLDDSYDERNDSGIHGYAFKPSPEFHFMSDESRSVPTFGIELETECVGASPHELANGWLNRSDSEGDFYLKFDGSLDNGIEVVSHPRSLASWREFCAVDFAVTLYEMARMGARAWNVDTTGLHVHVGRAAFDSPTHLARFGLLLNRNRQDAKRFAQRDSSYANFDINDQDATGQYSTTIYKAKNPYASSHFDAVNMSGNDGSTIEVPSLAIGRVLAAIEFVAGAVEYTRTLTAQSAVNGGLRYERFAAYLQNEGYTCASLANEGHRFAVAPTLDASKSAFSALRDREDVTSCV